jgi:hypothetical protein
MESRVTLQNAKHIVQSAVTPLAGWIGEMVRYRLYKCPECAEAGHCVKVIPGEQLPPGKTRIGCGCNVPAIMKVPQRKDSRGRWDQVANEEAWKLFKETKEYKEFLENDGRPKQVPAQHMDPIPPVQTNL